MSSFLYAQHGGCSTIRGKSEVAGWGVIPHSLLSEGLKHREGPRGQEDMKGKIHFEAEDGASK